MNETSFLSLFLIVLGLSTLVQWWLSLRHSRFVATHRGKVPEAFAARIPLSAHEKAADYTLAKTVLERIEIVIGVVLLLAWTLGGGLNALDGLWASFGLSHLWTGTGFLISLFVLMAILDIPMGLYRTFILEAKFGFNRTTPATFVSDQAKQFLLLLLIGLPLAMLVLWLMENMGQYWWLWVWAVWTGFGLLMMWAYPAFIAPLFNKFKPLDNEALRERIQSLLRRCGFTSNGIFVVDGSRRSGHGNAYFTGLGRNKRIVFFDTLLDSLSPTEIEAVLAHELGHFHHRHILKRIVTMTLFSLAGLALLGWLIEQPWFFTALGMQQSSLHGALALFLMVIPVFTFFLHPLMAWSSRKHEFEADAFAATVSSAEELVKALVKLYEENANTLTPDPLYSAFHDSHPPAPIRVAHLNSKVTV
ncbi:M48 family metallopeptidase [Sulfuriflexus mobilis]|uniref:M48 family metallopeptidase n=1 Tax=Sulfuriflexus mobilis TaxID=1811807 RepID=UPI000F83E33D|nr:M48 family metallopeptidase [Sulfuriflexus mobilis]